MRPALLLAVAVGLCATAFAGPRGAVARAEPAEKPRATPGIPVPKSIQAEHEAIHSALAEATRAPGRVGAAAKELAAVLHPHFVREEEIALPPLGLLAPLAAGARPPGMAEALTMSETLGRELPRMLEEHVRIRGAVANLRDAARAERAAKFERLAEELALHAQTEEEVLYPAAILVGEVIRARLQEK